MNTEQLLLQGLVYLAAAVLAVPVASRLGLGSVLGYLLAGVAIGPWALGAVADESASVMHFAELGVVMMLFLVGLELDPERLWRLRGPVFGLGGLQVAGTAAAFTPLGLAVGLPWQQALAVGLILAMSSTAIALQSLTEKGLLRTHAGQTTFAVLLFQDVAVIPILALFPALATLDVHHAGDDHGGSFVDGLPAWQHGLVVFAAVALVILAGRMAVGPLMRAVAATGLRELFTAAALLLVLAVDLLMVSVGLSAALGTFVAGVVLANSEYRHELVSDVEPFKGLLLGLFFMAVGASIDLGAIAAAPLTTAGMVSAVLLVKIAVLAGVARAGRLGGEQAALLAMALAQVGEFAFVLLNFAEANGVLPASVTAPLVATTAVSMAATPFLLTLHERVLAPRLSASAPSAEPDVHDEGHPVIIAGYGRFGQIAGRLLRAHGVGVTVLDVDSDQVEMLKRFGTKVFFGDASRLDLLHAAGAHQARVLLVAVDDPEKVLEIVDTARRHFPNLAILARARGRTEAFELLDRSVEGAYRETFDTALRAGVDALRLLGRPAHAAWRAGAAFSEQDERMLRELAAHRHEGETYVSRVRERLADFEALLQAEAQGPIDPVDHGWDSEAIRAAVNAPPS